jgi:hypothetical protein
MAQGYVETPKGLTRVAKVTMVAAELDVVLVAVIILFLFLVVVVVVKVAVTHAKLMPPS